MKNNSYFHFQAWVNAMRSFSNGTLKTDGHAVFGMPVKNTARVPLANHPAPHILRLLSPERMYCKYINSVIMAIKVCF